MRLMRRLAAALTVGMVLAGAGGVLEAQTTRVVLRAYLNGNASPQGSVTLLKADLTCNADLPADTSWSSIGGVANPTFIAWDDPDAAGKVCYWTNPAGTLFAGPDFGFGSYTVTVTYRIDTFEGTPSTPVAFTLAPAVPTPQNVKVGKPATW